MATRDRRNTVDDQDANRDPISGEPGAHPVGVGVGTALGGAAAGAGAGAVAGPVGAAIGAVVGGVAGGLAGKAAAEEMNPTVEDAFWKENYPQTDYYRKDVEYSHIQPAYRYGWESRAANAPESSFDEAEARLRRDWEKRRGTSKLSWDQARPATRDAWDRVDLKYAGQ